MLVDIILPASPGLGMVITEGLPLILQVLNHLLYKDLLRVNADETVSVGGEDVLVFFIFHTISIKGLRGNLKLILRPAPMYAPVLGVVGDVVVDVTIDGLLRGPAILIGETIEHAHQGSNDEVLRQVLRLQMIDDILYGVLIFHTLSIKLLEGKVNPQMLRVLWGWFDIRDRRLRDRSSLRGRR
jgi:hypothetical protein